MVAITQILATSAMVFSAVQALPQPQSIPTPSAAPVAPAPSSDDQAALFRDLFTAPTAIKRFQRLLVKGETLLTGEALKKMVVFPFTPAAPAPGAKGGSAKAAVCSKFTPLALLLVLVSALLSASSSHVAVLNTPHVHPHATEFLVVVEGSVDFGYVLENGLVKAGQNPEIASTLNKFEGTVFPQGSIHFQFNNNCQKATFVAALNSEDPGTSQVAQGFFALNAGVVNVTLGFPKTIDGKNIEEFRKLIPANLAQDIDVCLAKCKKN